jgi:hypothetical protein
MRARINRSSSNKNSNSSTVDGKLIDDNFDPYASGNTVITTTNTIDPALIDSYKCSG